MSQGSAKFFDRVQRARFYTELHRQAVALLPAATQGQSWLDMGCGPGLVARLAAQRGYRALGLDIDLFMVEQARRHGTPGCRFEVAGLEELPHYPPASVVSAASLLYVLPQPQAALHELWQAVRPGGYLLVIETTATFTLGHALRQWPRQPRGCRLVLLLWALARQGRAVDRTLLRQALPEAEPSVTPLLDGMVEAWVWRKPGG